MSRVVRPTAPALAAIALFSGVGVATARGQTFRLLSSPPGITSEWVFGMDASGQTLVGTGVNGSFFWSPATGFETFSPPPASPYAEWGYGVSGDGTTAVGAAAYDANSSRDAYRIRRGGAMEILGRLPGYQRGAGLGASHDGEIVVGRSTAGQTDVFGQAFRWTSTTGMVGLGYLAPGQAYSEATAISRDGSTIVGFVRQTTGYNQAFVWREGTGMVGLPGLYPTNESRCFAVNHSGSILVGDAQVAQFQSVATMWVGGVPTNLGIPTGFIRSRAYGVNDDGTVVVGQLDGGNLGQTAAVWTPARGMEPLSAYLAHHGIAVPAGINLITATAVSADGMTICGYTGPPGQGLQGWVVTIPEPAGVLVLVPMLLLARRQRKCFRGDGL